MAYNRGERPDSPMKRRAAAEEKSLRILWKRE